MEAGLRGCVKAVVKTPNPFPLILTPPPPNNKTSPLLHIGTILGGFSVGGWGGFSIRGKGLMRGLYKDYMGSSMRGLCNESIRRRLHKGYIGSI